MRHGGLKSQITNHKLQMPQRGYMLITLMLALALITIAMLAVLPEIGQQIKRDREEEMVHRGTSYMRAIQHFYKKFGRYPNRIEELENTNNLRFIRKRYTDPLNVDRNTGKERDFKFLHQTDINLNVGPVLGQMPGQTGLPGQGGLQGQGGLAALQGALGAMQGGLQQTGGVQNLNGDSGNPSSGSPFSGSPSGAPGNSTSSGSSSSSSNPNSSSGLSGQTFGGGPILGVASTSKAKTIRVFWSKNHYNDWLFIYLPTADRGTTLTGPVNPSAPTTPNLSGAAPGLAGGATPTQGGFGQGGFGQSGFGQGFGQGLTPNSGQNQGPQTQTPQTPAPAPAPQQ
jgi:type II secretory pathway pseudopilin PulG